MLITCRKVLTPKAKYIMPNVPHTQIALVNVFGGECEKKIFYHKFPFFFWKKKMKGKKNRQKFSQLPTIQYKRVLKIFQLSQFEYCQIWLNILMDNCHLSNITKVKKNCSFAHAILGSMSLNNTNYVDHHVNDIVHFYFFDK